MSYIITVAFVGYKLGMILVDDPIGMVFGIIGLGCSIYLWFWVMPDLLDSYAMANSIEMMKNRDCIYQVIKT